MIPFAIHSSMRRIRQHVYRSELLNLLASRDSLNIHSLQGQERVARPIQARTVRTSRGVSETDATPKDVETTLLTGVTTICRRYRCHGHHGY